MYVINFAKKSNKDLIVAFSMVMRSSTTLGILSISVIKKSLFLKKTLCALFMERVHLLEGCRASWNR